MTDLRQQAIDLIETMPEENLLLIVGMLRGAQKISEEFPPIKKEIDFSKYRGRGKKMFKSTEEIDNYVKELRDDRF